MALRLRFVNFVALWTCKSRRQSIPNLCFHFGDVYWTGYPQHDDVFHRPVIQFDLAPGHLVIRSAPSLHDPVLFQLFPKFFGHVAGIVAGTIFQFAQWGYITFQIGVGKYGAIYGSFAALPLFLLWLQISWLIVLFGGEISFAHQNVDTYEFEPDCLSASHSLKRLLSLLVVHLLVKRFCDGKKPVDAAKISRTLDIPVRLLRQILFELVEAGVVSEAKTQQEKEPAYQPGRDAEWLTIKHVIDTIEERGNDTLPVAKSANYEKISDSLDTFSQTINNSPANLLLK